MSQFKWPRIPKLRLMLVGLLVAVVGLASCTGADGEGADGGTTDESPTATSDPATSPETGASGGGEYVWAVPGEVTILNPSTVQGFNSLYYNGTREGRLLRFDLPPEDCSTLPDATDIVPTNLVESFESRDGGETLRFELRQGVESARGNELTTADIEWMIDRIDAVDPVAQTLLYKFGGVDESDPVNVIDEYTFEFNVSDPTTITQQVLTVYWFEVFDSEAVQENAAEGDEYGEEWLATNIANFGPWALGNFAPGEEVTYVPNPNYDAEGVSTPDSVTITTITDSNARLQLLQSGEADRVEGLSRLQASRIEGTEGVTVDKCASPYRDFLSLNFDSEYFDDVAVRRAVSLAINREELVEAVYQGYGTPAQGGVSTAFLPEADGDSFEYDPDRAQQLLEDAGYPDGFAFTLKISPGQTGNYTESLAVFIQSQLQEIGLDVTIENVSSPSAFQEQLGNGNFDAAFYTEPPAFSDPGAAYNIVQGCEARQNWAGACFDDLTEAADTVLHTPNDDPNREAAVQELSRLIDEHLPVVYLADLQDPVVERTCAADIPYSVQVGYPYLYNAGGMLC